MSKFTPTNQGTPPAKQQQDWTKYVTLNPPQAVIFRENKEEGKGASQIEIINKSADSHILFKVKTTEPNNYIVRPNQGVIRPDSSISVKIVCQVNLGQVSDSLGFNHR
jgi:hypothetical protein